MEILPKSIKYRKGYKYQLDKAYSVYVDIKPEQDIITDYVQLYRDVQNRIWSLEDRYEKKEMPQPVKEEQLKWGMLRPYLSGRGI